MHSANSPHLLAKLTVWNSDLGSSGLPARLEMFACMVPAFRMKYPALGSIFIASGPTSTTRKMQLRTTGATSGRPRRLASANNETLGPTETKLDIALDIFGAQIHPPIARKPPTKARMRVR